ncbi:MAG: heavy metal translocating P-type ATPase [Eubacteriales bacterium]|nr:heavy metal translocating P-type ATPase [Eubacteriales bacterium]MDD3290249.1 heavy metal translocating P-type ATPase [Eubacteriales bacterium]MDD3863172.1 heavy metal translocating P-type ATPase [Eubacteriales bacterium]MDD4444570.1 heavy metal translocating P-type ATPase [Eubacteriales bacterium]
MIQETYKIGGMSCASCAASVERVTKEMAGVLESSVNLATGKMTIHYEPEKIKSEEITEKIKGIGFTAELLSRDGKKATEQKAQAMPADEIGAKAIAAAILLSALLLYISMGPMLFPGIPMPDLISIGTHPVNYAIAQLLATIVVLFIGRKYFVSGFRSLYHRIPNMDSLVAISCSSSFLYSLAMTFLITDNPHQVHHLYYESAAVVLTFVMLGKHLEAGSKEKTKGAIQKLMELAPDTALLFRDGQLTEVPSDTLQKGDVVLVRPGAKFPADGLVKEGAGSVDESMLTGESIPVDKEPGSQVIGGSLNGNGALYVEVARTGEDTTLAKIIRFVEDAQEKKAPIAKIVDRIAGVFVPVVILIAVAAALLWLLLGKDLSFALRIFTAVLVIACPCALGLATPTAIIVGTGLGAGNGILIRSGEALETTHNTDVVVLDKTGTVTEGKPRVTEIKALGVDENELLALAALAEALSDHPLAKAVVEEAAERELSSTMEVTEFANVTGKGIRAKLGYGGDLLVGNVKLLSEAGIDLTPVEVFAQTLSEKGQSVIYVSLSDTLWGAIGVADTVKPTSIEAIAAFKELGFITVLLTGDNQAAAAHIGRQVGVDRVLAEVLPEEKAQIVQKLQDEGHTVLMVGDGINDAPALVQADIGCAIGNGSDIAIESADIVLIKSDLYDVIRAVNLSRLTLANIKQNLFWAFFYNCVGIPIAAGLLYPINGMLLSPMLAGFAMAASSIFVVTNALRLRTKNLDRPIRNQTVRKRKEEKPA